jgi:hypothetical protein
MAYSDYGGYAYRNGKRVEERSDAVISPDGAVFSSPGMWPGFAAFAEGGEAEYKKRQEWTASHVILGDGPVYLALYKSNAYLYYGLKKQDLPIDNEDYNANEVRRTVEFEGCSVELVYMKEDNHYVYARLTQPNGNVWHGFSGYGVGAGLEDAGYGFSTADREETLRNLWSESIVE